jgi:hypothetical protein
LTGKFESNLVGIEIQGRNVTDNESLTPLETPTVGSGAALGQAIASKARTGVLASTDEQPTGCTKETGSCTERDKHGLPVTRDVVIRVFACKDVRSGNLWRFTPGAQRK